MMNSIQEYAIHTKYSDNSYILTPPIILDILTFGDYNTLPESHRVGSVDFILCINMVHISPLETTQALFSLASKLLSHKGKLCTYGPYSIDGNMVQSNVDFDLSLKSRNPLWGIRDLTYMISAAQSCGLKLDSKIEMPSNNLTLLFGKQEA